MVDVAAVTVIMKQGFQHVLFRQRLQTWKKPEMIAQPLQKLVALHPLQVGRADFSVQSSFSRSIYHKREVATVLSNHRKMVARHVEGLNSAFEESSPSEVFVRRPYCTVVIQKLRPDDDPSAIKWCRFASWTTTTPGCWSAVS